MVLTDGAAHAVDSSDLAFRLASVYAFREAANGASPVVMEPVMGVEVTVPSEFQVWTLLIRPAASLCTKTTCSNVAVCQEQALCHLLHRQVGTVSCGAIGSWLQQCAMSTDTGLAEQLVA